MKCPICEMNVWQVNYREEVNIISLKCLNCANTVIDLDIDALYNDYTLRANKIPH